MENNENIIHSRTRRWKYLHYAGPIRSIFLRELRDNKKIVGTKCKVCNRVYLPARPTCYRCFAPMNDIVEVSNNGVLTTYTVVYQPEPSHPTEPPFIYGIIKLDGADTGIAHIVSGIKPENIEVGMKLEAVFREKRIGSILDIKYFKPIGN